MKKVSLARVKRIPGKMFSLLPVATQKAGVDIAVSALEPTAYLRLAERGFSPIGIIDVGAYEGTWTRLARSIFPDATTLMVEAQEDKKPFLDVVCADLPKTSYVTALLGGRRGEEVTFYQMETGSSFFPEQSNVQRVERTLTLETLDDVVDRMMPDLGPLFLKIDVQGAELQVLDGGQETLRRSEAVQLEISVLPYNKGAPTMAKVLQYMEERGFGPLEISGMTRPNGKELVQIDIVFVRDDSSLKTAFFNF